MATKREYGIERNFGDVIFNPKTKSVFCSFDLGFFGKTTVTLIKREDGCYDLMKAYKDRNDQEQIVKVGQTFPVKDKNNNIVEGLTNGTLGLLKKYDSEKQKDITDSSDALFITTHKLKEAKTFGNNGFMKVGYITGEFGIEKKSNSNENDTNQTRTPVSDTPEYDDDGDAIPF